MDKIETEELPEGYEQCIKLNDENWNLKQRISTLENYIKFKSLWKDFTEKETK